MEPPVLSKRVYRFGLFQVDSDGRKLLRQGAPVKLQEQPLRVLCLLLERPGEIVTRDELRQTLWPSGTYVEFDGNVNSALKRLRFALGDDADNPIFIETVPKHGYRFIAPVTCEPPSESTSASQPPTTFKPLPLPIAGDGRLSKSRFLIRRGWILAAIAVLLLWVGWRYVRTNPPGPQTPRRVVAVLPFSNEGAGPEFDYLRYAIANDLVTDLTHTNSVSVRPFASTSRYASQQVDPATVGAELRVAYVIAGGFLRQNKDLRVHLELVDVALNQPVWREEVTVPSEDLVALHDKLAIRAARGMLPAINISNASAADIPAPKNEQALDLFLHSLTIPLDPEPNQLAIKKLEESVSLDSGYAPAWGELGWRYYNDYHYGNRVDAALAKALQAYKRQSELDPDTPPVWTTIRVEQGDLNGAYDQAAEFLRRRPDSSMAHFGMSYVLRYAGLLDEAGKECDAALALDPGFNGFRSCALPFILADDYAHAQRYISLDESFGAFMRMRVALRTGDTAAVLAESNAATQSGFQRADDQLALFRTCLSHAPQAELSKAVAKIEADPVSWLDAELWYQNAEDLGFCGQGDAALRQLRKAIKGNHCSYPAMEKDPLFDPIRQRPEFAELHEAAVQCQQNFLAHRQQVNATLQVSRY